MARKPPTKPARKTAGKAHPRRSSRTGRRRPGKAAARKPGRAGELLDTGRAIRLLKTTRPTFYRWLRTGRIKGMKVGRQWRFRREDIDRFLKGQEPAVELPTDIAPLIRTLADRLEQVGGKDPSGPDAGPVTRAAAMAVALALKMRASDIHFDPYESSVALRIRVDGVLHQIAEFDIRLMPAVAEQFKRMAACDVAERRLPQDGRIVVEIDATPLDLRVCFLPALTGEAVTIRLLRRDDALISLDRIDYAPAERERLLRALANPWGMIVVAGPTGCGKTTVLYACLRRLVRPAVKVVSVEDPVEYLIPGVVQVPLRRQAGLTFARALRAVLRSDPDVILVAEIRSAEDLSVCQQAALTGHLVLTTLHTDKAPETLTRMVDIGSAPFLVGDATRFVSAQRLVRCLCKACSAAATPSADALARAQELARAGGLNWGGLERAFRKPVGCGACGRTGYRGRTLIVEMIEVTPEIAQALRAGAPADELRRIAIEQGMTTMAADGIRRAAGGQTSLDEVFRVLSVPC